MIGRTLKSRYQIKELLGEGSTAAVYKATDRRLGREVALKVLLPHVRETTRKRFFQEATAVAALNHPNIMAIYDMEEEDNIHFLVVEYVEGESLTKYIPASPQMVINLGRQIAQALGYAHKQEIIHRDVKPANIKVTPQGHVKIMDLGLALPREAKRVTADGMIIGTPAYLSPEQAQGTTLDARTDVYSLGVVLYEMATGELPFSTDDIPSLLLQHVKQPPPPMRNHDATIPATFESVVMKALEKSPARRFQSMEAFEQALSSALQVEEDLARVSMTQTSNASTRRGTLNESKTIRVVLADDHTILRRALMSFLSERDDILVVGEASNGDEAVEQAVNFLPDVMILDLNMPGRGGLDALPEIREKSPNTKVLVLTARNEDWYIMQALRAGAHGYVLKTAEEGDLIDSIAKVVYGNIVLGRGVAERVVTGMLGNRTDKKMTDGERQVILQVALGKENEEIASVLNMNMTSVVETLAQAMGKLGAKDRYAAALAALRRGDILLEELHTLQNE